MNTLTQPNVQLADIVAPTSPAPSLLNQFLTPEIITLVILMTVTVLLWVLYWHHYHSTVQVALRQIKQVQNACRTQQLSTRMASYRIALVLKHHLGHHYLSTTIVLPTTLAQQQPRWNAYLQRLHECRYAPLTITAPDIDNLLTETRFWVKQWP